MHLQKKLKSLKSRVFKLVYHSSPVLWANFGVVSRFAAEKLKPAEPPVVILSMPRSGSSWVGEVLGLAKNAMYLREPITQTYMKHGRSPKGSFFEFDISNPPGVYKSSVMSVSKGLPLFGSAIVKYRNQWRLSRRKKSRMVIKEVNPFMVEWLIKNLRPRIIYLNRHPAGIANSFNRLGWNGEQIEGRISAESLEKNFPEHGKFAGSFWSEFGALCAYIQKTVLKKREDYGDCRIVCFEEICDDPLLEFKKLYEFAGLDWSRESEEIILERSKSDGAACDNYSIKRDSAREKYKWKDELSAENIFELQEAYLDCDPVFYKTDWPKQQS